ncbi:MAG: enoyl-CoA hydratase/isomerase family protein [Hyphomicrobiaceae bacterium]|nr:enoyl-CoA hydratase/isomerase family protein [Hyphomicrobiaceae bacterium]
MAESWQEILYQVRDGVATITLNRPEKLNAWTAVMARELREALTAAQADEGVRAIIITGAGRGFCSGADMSRLAAAAAGKSTLGAASAPTEGVEANFAQRLSYMLAVNKPILAAINGPVAGVGLVVTFFCDMRYMAAGAKLTTAFARRGLIAEHGVAWLLPRLIGPMNALDLLYSARSVEAEEADKMGLVRVLPAEGFREAVQARAADIANLSSPRSTRIIKKQVYEAMFQSLAQATAIANREQEICRDTEDFREGVAHFLEKRKPNFTGR